MSLGYTRDPPRETLNIYGGSDYAVTSHGGDYTVHVVIGVDPENRMYLLDLWRGQTSSGVRQRPHPRNAPTILNAGLNFIVRRNCGPNSFLGPISGRTSGGSAAMLRGSPPTVDPVTRGSSGPGST